MADVSAAIHYVLGWEDSTLSGVITVDGGGRTRFGIAEKFHPELTASLFYSSMGKDAALVIAFGVYAKSYADPLCIEDIGDQDVANKLLSLGVNIGVIEAGKMLQDVLGIACNGRIGAITLTTLDQSVPAEVLQRLRVVAEQYYDNLIEKNPKLAVYRAGWLRRAEA